MTDLIESPCESNDVRCFRRLVASCPSTACQLVRLDSAKHLQVHQSDLTLQIIEKRLPPHSHHNLHQMSGRHATHCKVLSVHFEDVEDDGVVTAHAREPLEAGAVVRRTTCALQRLVAASSLQILKTTTTPQHYTITVSDKQTQKNANQLMT